MSFTAIALAPGVHWVGVLNPNLRVFDIIMRTEQGTTYNAYLVQGREKIALIEAVKQGFTGELLERIASVLPPERIDYVVCNHLEPDHSGALAELLTHLPKAQVVVSKNGAGFLKELLNQDLHPLTVGTGDRLDLGGKTLEFITAPFLHWPDTMFTYLPEEQVLFPCDFLGCHYSHPEILADRVDDFSFAFEHYFNAIMRPFKEYVRKGLDAIADKPLRLVATSHGPVLNRDIPSYLERYRRWSAETEPVPGGSLLVAYCSAYGKTEQLAHALAEGAKSAGATVKVFDLVGADLPDLVDLLEAADGLALGSCTINGDAVEPVWTLLASLATIKIKGKWSLAFGSYGWSGEAVPMLEERLRSLKFRPAAPGLRAKFTPTEADLAAAREAGRTLAAKVQGAPAGPPPAQA
jgi:NADH oxidase (H2O-forming)